MSGIGGVREETDGLEAADDVTSRPLADLPPGARAVVADVGGAEPPHVIRRLHDLGFVPGTEVEVVRRAPLRDPVVYRVRDYEVCLRRAQAGCVRVRVAEAAR
ncbi:FeoA family protein [Streptomyces sp. NPDC020996]|uniref:FeoA family protein n=1 Tax=Streptomyces sp. NPDC020996 TaxID=3154791 RepID=UPI0033C47678